MRKFIVSAALLASTIAVAAPAAAQWAPPAPQGYAYGYHGNYGQVRRLEARVDNIRRQIERLDRRDVLSNGEARRLREDARDLDRRINWLARNGFNHRDRYEVERRIARLEQRIWRDARDGNRYGNNGYGHGYNQYDRDRDGRIDRYEDDRGRDHDGRRDRDRDDD